MMATEYIMVITDELGELVRFCNELTDYEIEDILLCHPEYTISFFTIKGECYE